MTENEIIKALSCRSGITVDCRDCAYSIYKDCSVIIPQDALDLINRQQAEIEDLKERLEIVVGHNKMMRKDVPIMLKDVRAKVIKEFAERLKEKLTHTVKSTRYGDFTWDDIKSYEIDNLVKEMTEVQE